MIIKQTQLTYSTRHGWLKVSCIPLDLFDLLHGKQQPPATEPATGRYFVFLPPSPKSLPADAGMSTHLIRGEVLIAGNSDWHGAHGPT
jgi:hypothetical protein